jgi:hypothetical protein
MAVTLTVGTNTFISLSDANTYFSTRLFSTTWSSASDDNKSMALIMATKKITNLNLQGTKAILTQTLAFPRAFYIGTTVYSSGYGMETDNIRGEGWYIETDITTEVKEATCEEAISILSYGENANKRLELQAQGVTSFSIGNLSETYGGSGKKNSLLSQEATSRLTKYTGGGVRFI